MTKVLYIQASPRGERSHSVAVANAFLDAYRKANPDHEVRTLNVFSETLPEFNLHGVTGRYKLGSGIEATPEEKKAWEDVLKVIEEFKSADKYVFAVPMWNFGIPYRLKQYVDLVAHPTHTFGIDENGYHGLVTGKPAFVAYSRGGEYPVESPFEAYDFQKRYFDMFLGFIGFTDVRSIVVEPTLAQGPDAAKERRQAAIREAEILAATF